VLWEKRHPEGFTKCGIAKFAAVAVLAAGIPYFHAAAAQQPGQRTFPSAEEACRTLVAALQTNDETALLAILGPEGKEIVSSGDPAEDKENRAEFVQKYQQMQRLVTEPDGTTTLYIGAENWPTPIPLVYKGSSWYFDTPAGKQKILYRRIGRNELGVMMVCRELVDAEKEYYAVPHDGDSGREYAQKFLSDPNKHNGLYWEPAPGEAESPIGPLLAAAGADARNPNYQPQPFHGYFFHILMGQGANAPGGARSYIADGKMSGGFAFLAYPAEYRSSGVMTFIVDQGGIVYEKDLGPNTAGIAKNMSLYERDASWQKAD